MTLPISLHGLEALGDQLRAKLNSIEDGVLVHEPDGTIVAASPGAERLLGIAPNQLLGRQSPLELCRAYDVAGAPQQPEQCPAALCRATGESQRQIVLRVDRPDSALIWLSFDAYPLQTHNGVRYGVATWFTDVTERHLAESTRQRLLEEARDALRTRDAFLAVAAHELKTPLTALQLHLQSVIRGIEAGKRDPKLLTDKLTATVRQTSRLNHLVDVLLDVARISSGRLELNRSTIDLAELVRDVVQRSDPELRRAGCELRAQFADEVVGNWDIVRLDQVITNLLSNAAKYGGGGRIELELRKESSRACLIVRDFGIGIPETDHARVFGRFERAVSDTNYGGLGLGLWIVREIVEAHGGTIVVDSRAGAGATFRVELPMGT